MNEWNFVHFEFNEECNKYAELHCTPAPDNIYRINMQWQEIDAPLDVIPQEIKSANRTGFHIIEWGGQEIKLTQNSPKSL